MSRTWEADLAAERDAWRAALSKSGFSDDGATLHGPVAWHCPDGTQATATVEVTITESFPFSPPRVNVLDPGATLDVTFHRDLDGTLCLWSGDIEIDGAPWRDPAEFLGRVARWLEHTAAGWPDDDDCDLERYLPADPRMALYEREQLVEVHGCVRTLNEAGQRVIITGEPGRPPSQQRNRRRKSRRRNPHRPRISRKQRRLAWVSDVGQLERPISDWASLLSALDSDARQVRWLVSIGVVEFVVLFYRRGTREGALVLAINPGRRGTTPAVRACANADTGTATRMLRAGTAAPLLAERRVAVIGVGAVGSFVADLLFRSGLRDLTLLDPKRVRPGNPVRHLAGRAFVGYPKSTAVKYRLAALGFEVSGVNDRHDALATPTDAMMLLETHDLIIDATANPRATALLVWAANHTQRPVVSVCGQRQGGIVRVDRFPLRDTEQHLEALPPVPGGGNADREYGCDEPVSPTPPTAVMAAAELASRVVIDELTSNCKLPATLVNVLVPQEAPYDQIGIRMSHPR